ncbi:MAG: hypothetical protein JZD40_00460, partial [Sulfolobus sp.]|nr:hypothetical protein [Sulfolobus sp.]
EASTRTMIKRLRELDLINIDKVAGILITERGKEILHHLYTKVKIIENIELSSLNWKSQGIIIRHGKQILDKLGLLNLRDLIIKQGANHTIIAVVNEERKIELPPKTFDESEEIKKLKEEIKEKIGNNTQINDLIVIFDPPDLHLTYKITLAILSNG